MKDRRIITAAIQAANLGVMMKKIAKVNVLTFKTWARKCQTGFDGVFIFFLF